MIVIFSCVILDVIERDDERRWEVNFYFCELYWVIYMMCVI